MKIYDTLTEKKQPLDVLKSKKLKLFVCGPTVYDDAHIGHARTYITFDIIVRYLRSIGQDVYYLQNITDIHEHITDRAAREKTTPEALAKKYEDEYKKDMTTLGINQVTEYARASDHIPEIIKQIGVLKAKGHAYAIPGDGIYFDLSTFPGYGKLSHRTVLQAEDSVSRIDDSKEKRNKGDFALWKLEKPGEPAWDSPFGRGRPGWHIEDTAITEH
jgi:cysteinyl-tRNA synthetase